MAAIYLLLLCSFLISHETFGLDYRENGGNKNSALEKTEIEKYWENIKVIKRSLGNEIGANNINSDSVTTTSANSIYNSDPGTEHSNNVNVEQINPSVNAVKNQISDNSQNSSSQSDSSILYNQNDNVNSQNSSSSTMDQITNIDSNAVSGNETVNNNRNSTAISQSAILSSNHSSEDLLEHALSSSQNETKNATSDNFSTPITSTQKSASAIPQTSTNNAANLLGGNNLNTTPALTNEGNKMNNEIPELSTLGPDPGSVIQTTSASKTLITSSQQTTISSQSDTDTSNVSTTLKTLFEATVNNTGLSSSLAPSTVKNWQPGTNETFSNSSKTPDVIPENSPEPTFKTETNNVTNASATTQPEIIIGSSTKSPESEPLPESESDGNSTVVEPEPTAEPEGSSNETVNVMPETTAETVTNIIKSGLNSSESENSTVPPNVTTTEKATNNNMTGNESVPEPTAEPDVTLGKNGSVEAEPSAEPDHTNSPVTNLTTTEKNVNNNPTLETGNSSTASSTSTTTVVTIPITTKIDAEVSPEPEGEVTSVPEPESSTSALVNITTVSSTPSTFTPTTVTASVKTTVNIAPEINTTSKPEPSPETTHVPVTSNPEPSNNATTGSATVEPTAEPDKYSSTTKTHTEVSTDSVPEPTNEPTDKPDVEPDPEEENPESESEHDDAEGEPEYDGNAFVEPGPEWKLAKEVWKEAWEFHVYFFGSAFLVLGLYCVVTLIRLWNMEHLLSKHYFITLHLLVICVCILRATYLLVDAYNSLGTFPFGLDYFMYSTAFPCLTALFSLLFYALLLATRVRVISGKVQKLWVLVLIVSLHFLLSISTDIVVGLFTTASIMIFICQAFFILWGLLMFVGYLVLFRKLYKGAMTHQKLMMGSPNEYKHNTSHAYQVKPTKHKYTLGLAVKITFISAFFGVAIVGFELYGMFGVYGVLKFDTKPDPWPWWTYHTIVRSLEILMCLGVAYVASQPLRYKMKKDIQNRIYDYLLPCSLCCCPNKLDHNETYSSSISLDYVVSETDHLSWLKKIRNKSPSPKAPYPPHTAEKYSDPDATLLVRKIKRTSKPSMLVVEDGFVRIRREDENLPSNQYELDSRSSHSSDMNVGPDEQNTGALTNVENMNYTGPSSHSAGRENVPGVNFNNYLLQGSSSNHGYIDNDESADETDIDIVVTESEQESDGQDSPEGEESGASNKSADIFRPLSMIDLAASMESELDRAFHSNCVEETDIISHNSLPPSFDRYDKDSDDCAFNEDLCDKYCDNGNAGAASNLDSMNYSSDSADDQYKSSDARLIRPLVRRCKSDDSKSGSPKYKHFEKNKYFSVSSVDTIGKDEEFNTHFGSNGEMRTEL